MTIQNLTENIKDRATTVVAYAGLTDITSQSKINYAGMQILRDLTALEKRLHTDKYSILEEIGILQDKYNKLKSGNMSKQNVCDLVTPFRDKYHLTDLEALQITRNEISVTKMFHLLTRNT